MARAASARAEAYAAAKTMVSSVTVGAAATATYNNNPTKDKSVSNTTSSTPKSEACRTSLSIALTGQYSDSLEQHLSFLEKKYGTTYISEVVFNGDKTKYNPILEAEKKCGFSTKEIKNNEMAKKFNSLLYGEKHLVNTEDAYYCQTGGWYSNTDGGSACMATGFATLVSLTTRMQVKPNQVEATIDDGYLDKTILNWFDGKGNTYSVKGGSTREYATDIWKEISSELKAGEKGILIHLGEQHWVTVTGVAPGTDIDNIDSLNDLIGVDPWYNGQNDINPHLGTGNNSGDLTKSGEINLGIIKNKYGNPSGRYVRLCKN